MVVSNRPHGLDRARPSAPMLACILALMIALSVPRVRAVPPLPEEFVNDSVEMIAVFDLGQVTPSVIDATGRGIIENIPEVGELVGKLRRDYDDFVGAGGRFVVIAGAFTGGDEVYAFLPIGAVYVDSSRCHEEALTQIITRHAREITRAPIIERRGEWFLVWKQAHSGLQLEDEAEPEQVAPTVDPVRAQRLRAALAAIEGRGAAVVMVPPQEFRDEVADDLDDVPSDSPDAIPVLLASAHTIYGWVDLGHNPAVTVVAELPQAKQAAQLAGIVQMLPMLVMAQMPDPEEFDFEMPPEVTLGVKILKAISCVQAGNHVTVTIGHAHLRGILDDFAPILAKQQEQARKYQAMSNGRQIGTSIAVYVNDNDNQWPDSLDDLVRAEIMTREELDDILTHPVTGETTAFQYTKPDRRLDQMDSPSDIVILHELKNGAINQEGCVVYADGHAEMGLRDR